MDKNKFIIILIWFLDILAIWIIIPTLPDLGQFYGVDAHLMSYWITAFWFFSFLATPLLGQLSDIYGRKKLLNICVWGSFISSLVIALSWHYWLFIISRIINGITWGNISILQAIISDISKDKLERSENLWLLWTLFWAWFIVWPLFWAFLLHFWIKAPFWFMTFFCFLEIIVLMIYLEETNKHMQPKKIKYNPFGHIFNYLKKPKLNLFLISFFILLLCFSVYQWILSLYLNEYYWLSWSDFGYMFAAFWVIMVLNQVFLLKRFWLKKFSLKSLLYIVNIWSLIVFLCLGIFKPFYAFCFFFLMLVPFQTLLNPVYQWEMIEFVSPNSRWELMWVLASFQSMSMFIGPFMWGLLLERHIPIFFFSAFLSIFSIFIVVKILKDLKSWASA